MPRVRRLEVSDIVDIDGVESHNSTPEKNRRATLLTFDDDSDQETVPVPSIRYTKFWLSANGDLGCFECAFEDVLAEVARLTGTDISVKDDIKRIQVSGNSEEDVVDALEKLSRIEKPLVSWRYPHFPTGTYLLYINTYQSFAARPGIAHILQAPTDDEVRFRISNCSSVNEVGLRRILADPAANMASRLRQMHVTLLLNFDSEAQLYVLPDNLKAPAPCTSQPGRSRIWQDFKFQELGNGDSYLTLEADAEKEASLTTESYEVDTECKGSSSDMTSEVPVVEHPYLTEEQVKEVGRWVSDGWKNGAVGADLKQEIAPLSKPSKDMERNGQVTAAGPKRVAGIKTRRPLVAEEPLIPRVHTPEGKIMKEMAPSTETSGSRSPEKDKLEPRDNGCKRWVMTYDASPSQTELALSQENNESTPVSQTGIAGHSDVGVTSNRLIPETPERLVYISGIKFPSDFDRNKYGSPGKTPAIQKGQRRSGDNSKGETPSKSVQLIDIFGPSDTSLLPSDQRILSFDQPALIPVPTTNTAEDDPFTAEAVDDVEREESPSSDYETAPSESGISGITHENAPYDVGSDTFSSRRIQELRNALETQDLEEELDIASVVSTLPSQYSIANSMYKERLAELERASMKESKQSTDERSSRQFRRTMGHRAPRPGTTSSRKAEMKAKRQATLEDAWGMRPVSGRKSDAASAEDKKASENKKQPPSGTQILSHKKEKMKQGESDRRTEDSLKRLFDALQPILDAAQSFPGKLSLEMQIGLILIPLLPKTYKGDLISSDEWNRIFNPRSGVFVPSTNFVQRVTSSGADVDHIVDLKTSKAEGKRRLFNQEYTDYAVQYEYHCRAKNDQAIILVIDEAGNITVRKPTVTLGAVNLHFPHHAWDLNAVVSGFTEQIRGSDKELDEAISHITNNLWIPPDKSLLRLYTRIPKGNELNVDKVLMRRFTLHRTLRSERHTDSHHKIPAGVNKMKQASEVETGEPNAIEESQPDVYLKITEVQDLWTGVTPADNRALRARCGSANEMIEKGRLWYEVSIISPAIGDVLNSNSSLEVGEYTQDWSPTDLMGNEAHIVLQGNEKKGKANGQDSVKIPSPIAMAIGSAGIGEMFRVASTVLQKMDGVGFWNLGPGLEAARNAARFEALFSTNNFPAVTVTGAPSMAMVKTDTKGKNFEELESVKEMESASVVGEKEVLDFW